MPITKSLPRYVGNSCPLCILELYVSKWRHPKQTLAGEKVDCQTRKRKIFYILSAKRRLGKVQMENLGLILIKFRSKTISNKQKAALNCPSFCVKTSCPQRGMPLTAILLSACGWASKDSVSIPKSFIFFCVILSDQWKLRSNCIRLLLTKYTTYPHTLEKW